MTQQIINIGSAPNDGSGDQLRQSFNKCNLNFTELYDGLTASLPIGNAIQYQFNNSTSEPPGAQEIRLNNATQSAATLLWASHTTSSGINIKQFLSAATTGAKLILQDKNDNTNYIKFDVTGSPVDKSTYWEFPVSVTASGGSLPNAAILVSVTAAAAGGGAPTTAQYVVAATDATLSAERVGTNSTSITWDFGTAGQALVKRAALTGDVTAAADNNATTIVNNAVTYAKMQDVTATNRFLGRITAAAGDPEELTAANAWTILGIQPAANEPAHTGDVTNTAGSLAQTIANDAVTYAKMQNVSVTARVLGRKTAAAGDPEECTLSEVLDFVGTPAQGDILYRGTSTWTRLGAGTSGQFLRTNGTGANPSWAIAAGGGTVTTTGTPASGQWAQFSGATSITGIVTALMPFVQKAGDTMTGDLTLPGNPTSALQAATKQYVDTMLPLAGGTITGELKLSSSAPAIKLVETGAGGNGNYIIGYKGTDTNAGRRWFLMPGDGSTESGSNTGSDFSIFRYSDAGVFIDVPLTITRSTGQVTLSQPLNLPSYTVASLPSGTVGDMAFATNCRVFNGVGTQEGAGAGTGGLVTHNGTAWKIAGTNVTAVA